jgi:hypothetical protein
MQMHTFVPQRDVTPDRMFISVTKRLTRLRQKFLEDLSASERILVYKYTPRNLTNNELQRIYSAVRRYGQNHLLYVRYEDSAHPNGTVEQTADGLFVGYIDRFQFSPDGSEGSPSTVSWVAICNQAFRLWHGEGGGCT